MPSILLIALPQRFRNEVYICTILPRADVLLVAAYSTEVHPFGLVYEYMEGMDLRQYIQTKPNVGRLGLVFITSPTRSLSVVPLTFFANS